MTTLISFDPATGAEVGRVSSTDPADMAAHVARARAAHPSWGARSRSERADLVRRAGEAVVPHRQELTELLSREMGKDLRRASGEVGAASYGLGALAQDVERALAPRSQGGTTLDYRPLGVAGIVSPWNYPLAMAVNLLVPALVAGNTVVFKPSEETPLVADRWVAILNEVLPTDVLQIVHGAAPQGQALVDAGLDVIGFTGSMAAGQDIMRRAAPHLTRLVMELGGNDALIVLASADVRRAAAFAVASSFENAGQMCTSTERIYVDARIAEAFEQEVVQLARRYRVGPWNDPHADIGPIIHERQRARILAHIDDATAHGARVLLGGEHPDRYVAPTVLTGITDAMAMAREETFGPVVAIQHFADVADAIARANGTEYGLGAVVFGGDDAPAVADQLVAGMIGINAGPGGGGDAPWVGARKSGFGFHGSAEGHRQFAQVRVTRSR